MNNEVNSPRDPLRLQGFGPQDVYQRRERILTRYVGGFFQRLRFFTGWPLLTGYFLLPWLRWGDQPIVLFDLLGWQFHILNFTLFQQDLWLLGGLILIAAFALFTLTTRVGRLWCGYSCPQTVWSAIYLWAEQITEGPRHQRLRQNQAPWSVRKIRQKTLKHTLWIGCAALTGVTFVGYFTDIRLLTGDLIALQANGGVVFWVTFFSAATYFNAGWLREKTCTNFCPYGRLQSVMFDHDTLVVAYDTGRGEPRAPRKPGDDNTGLGDCIDCGLCVQVCPVGIDIRNGLQKECIGCAQCIDACAEVMTDMAYPPGLIRYTTHNELTHSPAQRLGGRSTVYAIALVAMIAAFTFMLFTRVPFAVEVIRESGESYRRTAEGLVTNRYELRVLNKSQALTSYQLSVSSAIPLDILSATNLVVGAGEEANVPLILQATPESIVLPNIQVSVELCALGTDTCVSEQTSFVGPLR